MIDIPDPDEQLEAAESVSVFGRYWGTAFLSGGILVSSPVLGLGAGPVMHPPALEVDGDVNLEPALQAEFELASEMEEGLSLEEFDAWADEPTVSARVMGKSQPAVVEELDWEL